MHAPSPDAVSTHLLSGLNCAGSIIFLSLAVPCAKGAVMGRPVWASQTRATASYEAVTTSFPSGLNRAHQRLLCSKNLVSGWPFSAAHIWAVPAHVAVMTRVPSGLNSPHATEPLGLCQEASHWLLCASHTYAVPSVEVVTIRFPVGLNCADVI